MSSLRWLKCPPFEESKTRLRTYSGGDSIMPEYCRLRVPLLVPKAKLGAALKAMKAGGYSAWEVYHSHARAARQYGPEPEVSAAELARRQVEAEAEHRLRVAAAAM